MNSRRSVDTYRFSWHLLALGQIVAIAIVVGLLAHDLAASLFSFAVGAIGFLVGVITVGKSRPHTVAAESSRALRAIVWAAIGGSCLIGITAAIQVHSNDDAAAWGAAVAAVGFLLIAITLVLVRSHQLGVGRRRHQAGGRNRDG